MTVEVRQEIHELGGGRRLLCELVQEILWQLSQLSEERSQS